MARRLIRIVAPAAAALAAGGCGADPAPVRDEAGAGRVVLRSAGEQVRATSFGECEVVRRPDGGRETACPGTALDAVPTPETLVVEPEARIELHVEPPAGSLQVRLYPRVTVAQSLRRRLGSAQRPSLERAARRLGIRRPEALSREQLVARVAARIVDRDGAGGQRTLGPPRRLLTAGGGSRWQLDLPARVPDRMKLEVVVERAPGVANFVAAVAISGRAAPSPPRPGTRRPHRCPRTIAGQPAEGRLDSRELVGLTLREAREKAARYGCTVRVERRDGRNLALTSDLRPDRIGVVVEDGRVTDILGVA